jgi:hypothetical protein
LLCVSRRADVTGAGAWEPHVEELALPKSLKSCNFSLAPSPEGRDHGPADPTGYESGRKNLSRKSQFTRDRKPELDFNALIRGGNLIGLFLKSTHFFSRVLSGAIP